MKILNQEAKKQIELLSKQINEKLDKDVKPDFRVVASTEDIDRDGEKILIDAWDLKNYKKSPVILCCHNWYSVEDVIGKAINIKQEGKKLIIEWVFSKTNPKAILVKNLYDEGILKTVSVGFIPKEREWNTITKAELLELSFVPIPANPNALTDEQKALIKKLEATKQDEKKEKGEKAESEIKEIKETLNKLVEEVKEIKTLFTDGKVKEQKDFEVKEILQTINRATADALREFKKK